MRTKQSLYFLTATLALLFFTFAAQGEEKPFITKWKGEANKELKIPIFGTGYKLVIKKASDNSVLITEPSLTITENENFYSYTPAENGELLVEAGPEGVEYIRFVYNESTRGSAENLLTIEQFGTVPWKSMQEAFLYCKNMQFAPTVGTPDLSNVTDMERMFFGCSSFNQDLSSWNVSNVTNMRAMFYGCSSFNQDLSSWNVSNVTDMRGMFSDCSAFDQDLSSWNVSNVTNMEVMFYGCSSFNQDISGWNVSNVKNMYGMFSGCSAFDQDISSWNVSNVTNMGFMFNGCSSFNQDLGSWNVSNVTNMENMFFGCSAFNQNLGSWTLKKCKTLGLQRCGMSIENYSKSLEGWAALSNIIEGLKLDATGLKYSTEAKKAREKLVNEKNWHIEGDELATIPVTGVSLSQTELSLEKGKTATLTATVAPSDATNKKVTWSSNNTAVATVENGTVTAVSEGNATITVTTEDGGRTATCSVTVTPPAAVEDAVFASVVVSPNPFNTQLRISNGDVRGKYTLYNTQGVEVALGVLEGAETRINTISLPAGLYLLRLTAENGATKTFTVVKN